jgi:hypothetical protein
MNTTFFDKQDRSNSLNGTRLRNLSELTRTLGDLTSRQPFFVELHNTGGAKLLVGVGREYGCCQYGSLSGEPPYSMAVAEETRRSNQSCEFLIDGTATEIPGKYCIPMETVLSVAMHFVETGQQSQSVEWEEI